MSAVNVVNAASAASTRQIAIAAVGLVTSVGLDSASSCAALRCRLNNFTELAFDDHDNEPVTGAPVPWPNLATGLDKLAHMAASAIRQALADHPAIDLTRTPLLLCVAERERSGRINDLDNALFSALTDQFNHPFHPDSGVMPSGQVGIALALDCARKLLYDKNHPAVVIVAADTLLNRATIIGNLDDERLLATDIRAGFIPGEAAGALLVKRCDQNIDVELLVFGIGIAQEKATRDSDLPLRAEGLTQAIKAALRQADATADELDLCIADVSGEDYDFEELALAQQRCGCALPLWLPAESLGKTGSVAGCIPFAWLLEARRKFYIPGNNALFLMSNDNGQRAAIIVAYQYSQAYQAQGVKTQEMLKDLFKKGARHGA